MYNTSSADLKELNTFTHTDEHSHTHTQRQSENHSYRDETQEVGKHLRASISFLWGKINIVHVKLCFLFPHFPSYQLFVYILGEFSTQFFSDSQTFESQGPSRSDPAHSSILPSTPPLMLFYQQNHCRAQDVLWAVRLP